MKIGLLLILLLTSQTAAADVSIGASCRIGKGTGNTIHGQCRAVNIEIGLQKYVVGIVLEKKNRPGVSNQALMMIQRQYGNRFYVRPGLGIANKTKWNTVLNLCGSLGFHFSNGRIEWSHCSNGGTGGPNAGIDFITLKMLI